MAKRPVFIPIFEGENLVKQEIIEFTWFPGYSKTQKQKSIESLHYNIKKLNISPVLEISTKSFEELGENLSAFNLKIRLLDENSISVESAYQGSKIFENGGPFRDMFLMNGFAIKKDYRLYDSGKLLGFNFENEDWDLTPTTAFYDWLYLKALQQNDKLGNRLIEFKGFTDIEYNPNKSFSCQARTAGIYVSLFKRNLLNDVLKSKSAYLNILREFNVTFNKIIDKSESKNESQYVFL